VKIPCVITGVGLATPLGKDRETGWRNVVAGLSATKPEGAWVPWSQSDDPRAVNLALLAGQEAWADAGLSPLENPERLSCVVSCSKPLIEKKTVFSCLSPDIVPTSVARRFGAGGRVMNMASACATGTQSLLTAMGWIAEGAADVVLAGASESSLHFLYEAGFDRLGVLSASGRCRPFDRDRDGFVMGEGAAVFVVESHTHAHRRGAHVYGVVLGGSFSCEATHTVRSSETGMSRCLLKALTNAGVSSSGVDYVNAHGTGTALNDSLECNALLSVFDGKPPPVSSTKGATGHLLGATGAVEIAFSLLAMRDNILPPTVFLEHPLSDRVDFVPLRSRSEKIELAVSVSFGFGGALAAVVLGAP